MNLSLSDPAFSGTIFIAFLALVHSSFQLGTSVLTLLNGHSLSKKVASKRLALLNSAYTLGALLTTFILITLTTTALYVWLPPQSVQIAWIILAFWATIVGWLVMATYFRRGKGTRLWIPRSFANYLTTRASRTNRAVEALALGIISVIAELPFTGVILIMVSLALVSVLPANVLIVALIGYSLAICLPLIIISKLATGGYRLSNIQRWRESNKVFLQYASGIGLVGAALYALVYFVMFKDPY